MLVGCVLATSGVQAQGATPTVPAAAPEPAPAPTPQPTTAPPPPPPSYPEATQPAPPPASELGKAEPEIEPPPAPIFGDRPRRVGFTLELGLGLGITHIAPDGVDSDTNVGLAPLSLSLGGFISSDVSLMARMAGTSWFEDLGSETAQIGSYFYGIAMQYWPSDAAFVGGGIGYGLLALNPFFSSDLNVESQGGLIFTLRGGYAVYTSRNHWLGFTLELFPAFYDNVTVFGTAINFQWQLL
jgi:hypothetical protein